MTAYIGEKDEILHLIHNVSYISYFLVLVLIPWRINLPRVRHHIFVRFRWIWKNIKGKCRSYDVIEDQEDTDDNEGNEHADHLFSYPGLFERIQKYETCFDRTIVFIVIVFFMWPLVHMTLTLLVFFNIDKPKNILYNCTSQLSSIKIARGIQVPLILYFGFFTCIVYLLRKTFEYQMKNVALAAKTTTILEIERRILKIWLDLIDYRRVVGWYVCITTTTGALALVAHVKRAYSETNARDTFEWKLAELKAWSGLLFPLQTLVAAGSYNIDHIWDEFKLQVMKNNEMSKTKEIIKHLNETYTLGDWATPTVVFAAITLFAAMNTSSQSQESWLRPGCQPINTTMVL